MGGSPPQATGSRRSAVVTGDVATGDAAALSDGGARATASQTLLSTAGEPEWPMGRRRLAESHRRPFRLSATPCHQTRLDAAPESSEGDLAAYAETRPFNIRLGSESATDITERLRSACARVTGRQYAVLKQATKLNLRAAHPALCLLWSGTGKSTADINDLEQPGRHGERHSPLSRESRHRRRPNLRATATTEPRPQFSI